MLRRAAAMIRASVTPPGSPTPGLSADEERRVLHNIDRIEDRLRDAPEGLHDFGEAA